MERAENESAKESQMDRERAREEWEVKEKVMRKQTSKIAFAVRRQTLRRIGQESEQQNELLLVCLGEQKVFQEQQPKDEWATGETEERILQYFTIIRRRRLQANQDSNEQTVNNPFQKRHLSDKT